MGYLLDVALSRQWVSDRWLVGVKDYDPQTGKKFPPGLYTHAIRQGREQAEGEFDVSMTPTEPSDGEVDGEGYESIDLTSWSGASEYLINLKLKPLLTFGRIDIYDGNTKINTIDRDAVLIQAPKFSQIQLDMASLSTPTPRRITFNELFALNRAYGPGALRAFYTAGYPEVALGTATARKDANRVTGTGFRTGKKVAVGDFVGFEDAEAFSVTKILSDTELEIDGAWTSNFTAQPLIGVRVPSVLLEYTGLLAARSVLIVAGDLVIGAGISSMSRSEDGHSQSIQTTASPENNAYSARIRLMDAQLESLYKRAMRDYRPQEMIFL